MYKWVFVTRKLLKHMFSALFCTTTASVTTVVVDIVDGDSNVTVTNKPFTNIYIHTHS